MKLDEGVWKASAVFAPDFPRQSSDNRTIQSSRSNRVVFCESLEAATRSEMPGYYSVYSFPRGHSRDGNIPKVDCIFIDLDVEGDGYDPKNGTTGFEAWRRDMSALLARARMIADAILESEQEQHFRVALSGHKGLHLYLDFPEVAPANGSFEQFKNGLKEYGEQVMSWLESTAGGVNIDPWVDVDASDLGRLARYPNTVHHGAVYDDKTRWCVPITVEELAELRVEDYLELTLEPRWSDEFNRTPSKSAGNKVVQMIRNAAKTDTPPHRVGTSKPNYSAIEEYESRANGDIEVEDIPFLTANFPCIVEFLERDDAWDYGNASHLMELNVISLLVEKNVPRRVIHELFEEIPGYDEGMTDEAIDDAVAREYKSFNCSSIADRAQQFCLAEACSVYKRNDDIQK